MNEKRNKKGKALVIHVTRDRIRIANAALGPEPVLSDFLTISLTEGLVEDGAILQPEAMHEILRKTLERDAYKSAREVIFVLCSTQVVSETASLPRTAEKRLEKLLTANMDMYFPIRVDDYKLTWEIIGPDVENPDQMKVQLWAVPREMLRSYYVLANECGLSVAAIDFGGHALATVVGASFASPASAAPPKKKRTRRASRSEEDLS